MNSSKCAVNDVSSMVKRRNWLVEPAGTYNKGCLVQTGFRSLVILISNPDIEGYPFSTKSLIFEFFMLFNICLNTRT